MKRSHNFAITTHRVVVDHKEHGTREFTPESGISISSIHIRDLQGKGILEYNPL